MSGRVTTIGIDEAGYAPRLGPMVVTAVRLELPDSGLSLYDALERAVTRDPPACAAPAGPPAARGVSSPGPRAPAGARRRPGGGEGARRIRVADSKTVYGPGRGGGGLADLERGALAFARLAFDSPTLSVPAADVTTGFPTDIMTDIGLARALAGDTLDISGLAWYGGAPARLPVAADAEDVARASRLLAEAISGADITGLTIRSRVVTARELNRAVAPRPGGGVNKAEFLLGIVASLMRSICASHRSRGPKGGGEPRRTEILVDRLGGRKFYRPLLERAFAGARVLAESEESRESCYSVEAFADEPGAQPGTGAVNRTSGRKLPGDASAPPGGARIPGLRASVTFACEAESRCMTVALASMVSKYVRELFMARMNRYFRERLPGLRPTAGYPQDAARFLAETADLRAREAVPDDLFVRAR